jgi:hypothetical protein
MLGIILCQDLIYTEGQQWCYFLGFGQMFSAKDYTCLIFEFFLLITILIRLGASLKTNKSLDMLL